MSRIIITPLSKDKNYWKDVWDCRNIILILAWRDVIVRYKQTAVGVFWTLLKPALTIIIFWTVSSVLNISHDKIPQVVLVGSAVLPWQFVSSLFSDVSNSLINNEHIIKKIYFPLITIPLSSSVVSLIDFTVSLILLILIFGFSGFTPPLNSIFLPFFTLLGFMASFGSGLFFSSSSVKYRDFRVLVPFVVQIALYLSPVVFTSQMVYESTQIHDILKILYACNPYVCVIDGFRWCLTGININFLYFMISAISLTMILIFGIFYFRRSERYFAEYL
jgi:lipopolysaccharide transport system permease protein